MDERKIADFGAELGLQPHSCWLMDCSPEQFYRWQTSIDGRVIQSLLGLASEAKEAILKERDRAEAAEAKLKRLGDAIRAMPRERAHTYASENAGVYIAWDNGYNDCLARVRALVEGK